MLQYLNKGPVAQRLEQYTHNVLVPGSNPGGPTKIFIMKSKFNGQSFLKINFYFLIFLLLILVIHQIIFQQFFPNSNGFLGHDYEYFIPNLMFGKIWFYNNFLSTPWFTPSFCCGIPFYADAETMYYSINQIIFLIFNPILAIKITFFALSLIAYIGMFLLAKKNLRFNNYTSLMCAGLFLFNGFFVYRSISGHFGHLSYIFIPLYCYFLISSFENQSKRLSIIYLIFSSIIFANFFHSGSGPIIFIIFTSILAVLLFYSQFVRNLKIFFNFIVSLFIGILISLSKISAVLFFLNNFPRQYPAIEFNSIISFIKTFFLSFFYKPNEKYFNDNVTSMFPLGVHELEYGVSIVPIILLFFIFFLRKKIFKLNYYNAQFLFLVVAIFLIPIFLNVNFLSQFQLIQKIPILNSTWVNVRFMSVYILPIIIISGFIIENLNINVNQKKYLAILMIFFLLTQNVIRDKSWHINDQKYDTKNVIDFSLKLKTGKNLEILGPAALMDKFGSLKKINNRNDMFFFAYSPIACYQATFGYGLEELNAKKIVFNSKKTLQDDSYILYSNKLDKKDGHFMFFNPSCFLFPEENNCIPGDTFKIAEKEKLIKFTNYKKFKFKQNNFQMVANYVSIFTFIGCLLYLIYHLIMYIYNFSRKY